MSKGTIQSRNRCTVTVPETLILVLGKNEAGGTLHEERGAHDRESNIAEIYEWTPTNNSDRRVEKVLELFAVVKRSSRDSLRQPWNRGPAPVISLGTYFGASRKKRWTKTVG